MIFMKVLLALRVRCSLGPRPKPTPARIASSITHGDTILDACILDAIRAGVGLGLGPRLGQMVSCICLATYPKFASQVPTV